jgi:hypothetical protein
MFVWRKRTKLLSTVIHWKFCTFQSNSLLAEVLYSSSHLKFRHPFICWHGLNVVYCRHFVDRQPLSASYTLWWPLAILMNRLQRHHLPTCVVLWNSFYGLDPASSFNNTILLFPTACNILAWLLASLHSTTVKPLCCFYRPPNRCNGLFPASWRCKYSAKRSEKEL